MTAPASAPALGPAPVPLHLALDALRFDGQGLIPVVVQDHGSGQVLMVAWADREALELTLQTSQMHFHSRSRDQTWRKGATSGHLQDVKALLPDCDGDTVLALVSQQGHLACHRGTHSCFDPAPPLSGEGLPPFSPDVRVLAALLALLRQRDRLRPEGSYTTLLLEDRQLVLKKIGEEATEVVLAGGHEGQWRLAEESADLLYHLLVLLQARGVDIATVWQVLADRHGTATDAPGA